MRTLIITLLAIAVMVAAPASAQEADSALLPNGETQDECATRLAADIRISNYADAMQWIQRFEEECALPESSEIIPPLEIDTLLVLPEAQCAVRYWQFEDGTGPSFLVTLSQGLARVLHRRPGTDFDDWRELANSGTAAGPDGTFLELLHGGGLHEFEIRSSYGADVFQINETAVAGFVIQIYCPPPRRIIDPSM